MGGHPRRPGAVPARGGSIIARLPRHAARMVARLERGHAGPLGPPRHHVSHRRVPAGVVDPAAGAAPPGPAAHGRGPHRTARRIRCGSPRTQGAEEGRLPAPRRADRPVPRGHLARLHPRRGGRHPAGPPSGPHRGARERDRAPRARGAPPGSARRGRSGTPAQSPRLRAAGGLRGPAVSQEGGGRAAGGPTARGAPPGGDHRGLRGRTRVPRPPAGTRPQLTPPRHLPRRRGTRAGAGPPASPGRVRVPHRQRELRSRRGRGPLVCPARDAASRRHTLARAARRPRRRPHPARLLRPRGVGRRAGPPGHAPTGPPPRGPHARSRRLRGVARGQ